MILSVPFVRAGIAVYVCAIMVCACACSDDRLDPDYTSGKISVVVNGEYWEGPARGGSSPLHGVYLNFEKSSRGILKRSLDFIGVPQDPGTYRICNCSWPLPDSLVKTYFSFIDEDVIEENYTVVEDESYFTVKSYNKNTGIMTGMFDAVFTIDTSEPKLNPANPDILYFEDGRFEVLIR